MFIVRDIFQCKPGKAKDLVNIFKQTKSLMEEQNYMNTRILTDTVSNYWTVVLEIEVESLSEFENMRGFTSQPKVKEIMKDYMSFVVGGSREILRVE